MLNWCSAHNLLEALLRSARPSSCTVYTLVTMVTILRHLVTMVTMLPLQMLLAVHELQTLSENIYEAFSHNS